MRDIVRSAVLIAFLAAVPALAADTPLDPASIAGVYKHHFSNAMVDGTKYTSEDILEIVRRGPDTAYVRGRLEFSNGHVCNFAAIAETRGQSLVISHKIFDDRTCVLTIAVARDKLTFDDKDDICRAEMCGARGVFEGQSFERSTRRTIHYMPLILNSPQFADAVNEYNAAHPDHHIPQR